MRDVLRGKIEDAVVQAGSRTTTEQAFSKIFSNIRQNYEEQAQQPYPLEEAVKAGVDQDLVDRIASEQSYFEMLSRSGVRPSDDVLVAETVKAAQSGQDPELARVFDSVTGKFRPDMLARLLNANGLTQDEFDRERRDNLANEQFGSAVSDGFRTPRIYAAVQVALSTEARDVTYFVIPETSVAPPPAAHRRPADGADRAEPRSADAAGAAHADHRALQRQGAGAHHGGRSGGRAAAVRGQEGHLRQA